jgi:hypothetical protein
VLLLVCYRETLRGCGFGCGHESAAAIAHSRPERAAAIRSTTLPAAHDDVANAAMGCAVMCDKAGMLDFNRKLVYPRLSVA